MQRSQREIRNVFFFLAMGCAALMSVGCDDGVYNEEPDDSFVPGTTEMDDSDYVAPENDLDMDMDVDDGDLTTEPIYGDTEDYGDTEEMDEPSETTGLFEGASEDTSPLNLNDGADATTVEDADTTTGTDQSADSSPQSDNDTEESDTDADSSDFSAEDTPDAVKEVSANE